MAVDPLSSAAGGSGSSSSVIPSGTRKLMTARSLGAAARFSGASFRDDPARGDDSDPVGEPLGLVHVVRGEEDRRAERAEVADRVPGRRRADGSKPVVGSSRKRSSGSPASASATSRRGAGRRRASRTRASRFASRPTSSTTSSRRTRARDTRRCRARSSRNGEHRARRRSPAGRSRSARGWPAHAGGVEAENLDLAAFAARWPSRISTMVVLPAPFGPSRPKTSPRAISR